jgi:hypothetical protein
MMNATTNSTWQLPQFGPPARSRAPGWIARLFAALAFIAALVAAPATAQPVAPPSLGYPVDSPDRLADSFARAWHNGDWIVVYGLLAPQSRTAFAEALADRDMAAWIAPHPTAPAEQRRALVAYAEDASPGSEAGDTARALIFAGLMSTAASLEVLPLTIEPDVLVEVTGGEQEVRASLTGSENVLTLRLVQPGGGDWSVAQVLGEDRQGRAWRWPDGEIAISAE